MGSSSTSSIRNIAVVGHKGCGKTSLVEAMLYLAKVAPKLGKTGDRAAGLDDSPEEKAHQATFESRAVTVGWRDCKLNLLDTPGDPNFFADTQLSMAVADAVLLVVSAKMGVESGTERLSRWLLERRKPCFVVVTRVDDEHAAVERTIEQVRALKEPVELMEVVHHRGAAVDGVVTLKSLHAWLEKPDTPASHDGGAVPPEMSAEVKAARQKLVDDVAATDDTLTEHFLNDGDLSEKELDEGVRRAVAAGKLVPLYCTSSTVPVGIAALMDALVESGPSPLDRGAWPGKSPEGPSVERRPVFDEPVSAVVLKTRVDPHAGRLSTVRIVSGKLSHDSHLVCGADGHRERVAQILQGAGKDLKVLPEAVAGDIVHVAKLKYAGTGSTLCDERQPVILELPERPPTLFSRALLVDRTLEEKAGQILTRLAEEDPGLVFSHTEGSKELVVLGLGAGHLDVTLERLRRKANIDCKLGPPRIAYRETFTRPAKAVEGKLKKQTGGHGQYAVCYLDVEPLPRGSGFVFENAVVGGAIPRQFIPSVEKGVLRALQQGVLAGYPLVDVKVRVTDGKFHSVDSSDAAFQTAGFRGLRAAAAQAHAALLEPIMQVRVSVPTAAMGDVIGDLNSRHGKVLSTDGTGDSTLITAHVPVASLLEYEPVLSGLTHGKGVFSFAFDHYEFCLPQVQEKVVRESGFKATVETD